MDKIRTKLSLQLKPMIQILKVYFLFKKKHKLKKQLNNKKNNKKTRKYQERMNLLLKRSSKLYKNF